MRRVVVGLVMALYVGGSAAGSAAPGPTPPAREYSVAGGGLGKVTVYAPAGPPGSIVLLVSGADGWNSTMVEMAQQLRSWGALVAGLDVRAIPQASVPVGEFEQLGRRLAGQQGLPASRKPFLAGYAAGGRLAHSVAEGAPEGTFGGLITLGACIDLTVVGDRPAARRRGSGLPWLALHGALDAVCSADRARAVASGDPAAKFVLLPKVGHTFAAPADWLPQFHDAYAKLVTAVNEPAPVRSSAANPVADLPLVEVKARKVVTGPAADTFVVLLTGDGGWAGLDQEVAGALARRGIPVVALSTLRYFWRDRSPAEAALDLDRIVQHYVIAWRRQQVLLVGYSFGANVLPFLVGHLPRTTRQQVRGIALLAPATHTGFEVHVADWIPGSVPEGQPVQPALKALNGVPILCVGGAGEGDNLCASLPRGLARSVELPGGHHFDGDSATLAREILAFTGL